MVPITCAFFLSLLGRPFRPSGRRLVRRLRRLLCGVWQAVIASQNLSRLSRRTTRTALQEPVDVRTSFQRFSASMRISRMGTMKQNKMIHDVSEAAPKEGLKGASLEERLQAFGMSPVSRAFGRRSRGRWLKWLVMGIASLRARNGFQSHCKVALRFRTMAFNLFRAQAPGCL